MSANDINAELKKYKAVYIGLLVCTVITVAISYLHLAIKFAVILALIVAVFKASLVSGFFMHLTHEKKPIYYLLILTIFLFISLIVLLVFSHHNVFEGLEYVS